MGNNSMKSIAILYFFPAIETLYIWIQSYSTMLLIFQFRHVTTILLRDQDIVKLKRHSNVIHHKLFDHSMADFLITFKTFKNSL